MDSIDDSFNDEPSRPHIDINFTEDGLASMEFDPKEHTVIMFDSTGNICGIGTSKVNVFDNQRPMLTIAYIFYCLLQKELRRKFKDDIKDAAECDEAGVEVRETHTRVALKLMKAMTGAEVIAFQSEEDQEKPTESNHDSKERDDEEGDGGGGVNRLKPKG